MADLLLSLMDALAGDPQLLMILLGLSGAGLVVVAGAGVVRGRQDVRRRAASGLEERRPAEAKGTAPGRADARRTRDRLMAFVEAALARGDQRQNRLLRLQLIQAGFFDRRAVAAFFAARLAGAGLLGVTSLVLLPFVLGESPAPVVWMWAGGVAIIGYFLPTVWLRRRIARRVQQHRMGFPDFMDLMVVCAEAGLSMEASVDRIARELVDSYPSLAENLYMLSLEMRAGKAFTEALERLGARLGIEEATMLATLLQQSAELGTSLSQSLRIYSEEMRNKRLSRAEEKAYALPAKLVVPLTLFVFPVLLVALMLPVVIRMSAVFGT